MEATKRTKLLIGLISLASIAVLAGTISDFKFQSDSFMNKGPQTKFVQRLDDELVIREIASSEKIKINIIHFPVNDKNKALINGKWNIFKYTYNFDKGEKRNDNVIFDLVGNAKVMIQNDSNQIFSITKLENNTIRLVKQIDDNDYEVLDAQKIIADEKEEPKKKEIVEISNQEKTDNAKTFAAYYTLEKAQNPVTNKIFNNTKVRGEIDIDESLENSEVLELTAEIEGLEPLKLYNIDAGEAHIFNADYYGTQISGRYSKEDDAIKVRFFTGPLAGLILEYVSHNKFEENRVADEENRVEQQELFRGEKVFDRTKGEMVDMEQVEELSPAEMEDKVATNGFDFSQE